MIANIRHLLLSEADTVAIQVLRYGVVGAIAFLADLATLVVLTEFANCQYLISAAAGFGVGVAANYFLSITWVFTERGVRNRAIEFASFFFLGLLGLSINELTLYLMTGLCGIHYVASKCAATAFTFTWNFASRRLLLFTSRR